MLDEDTYLWNLTWECYLMSAIYNLNFDLRSGVERKFVYKHLLYRPRFLYTQRRKIWRFKLTLWLFREYSIILPLKVKWCYRQRDQLRWTFSLNFRCNSIVSFFNNYDCKILFFFRKGWVLISHSMRLYFTSIDKWRKQ